MVPDRARGRLSADTSADAEDHLVARWRTMSAAEKFTLVESAGRMVDTMARAGIRLQHPQASDRELFLRLAARRIGWSVVLGLYPDARALADRDGRA